ncbi:MAG: hypothetical protein ABL997_03785 [Planctomycetota bacterium]
MSVLAIACDNCGAKYRLPESFSGDKAKCQKCGSVIDVAAQRKASGPAPAPAKVAPAKAAPAPAAAPVARSARTARTENPPAAKAEAAPARTARAGRQKDAAPEAKDNQAKGSRRDRSEGGEREPKKSNTMLLVGGGIAAIAIVAVIVVLGPGKKDASKTDTAAAVTNQDAGKPNAEKPTPTPEPAPVAKTEPKVEPKTEPAAVEASAKPADAKTEPAIATPDKQAPAKVETPAQPADDGTPKEKWERNTTKSLDEVFDPKTLGELSWPAEADDAQRESVRALVAAVVDGGKPARSAKTELEKLGYFAAFGIAEKLRQLDYKSSSDQMTAWEFNKVLETIFAGLNAGFVAVEDGADLDPRKADHNARTAEAWGKFLSKYPTKAEFDSWRKERLKRGDAK